MFRENKWTDFRRNLGTNELMERFQSKRKVLSNFDLKECVS